MKKLGDIFITIMLTAAFGVAFYAGFYAELLNLELFALISGLGLLAMFIVGAGAEYYSRAKAKTITKSFLAGFISQLAMVVFMLVLMAGLWVGLFPIDSLVVKCCYCVFVLVVLAGYCQSIAYSNAVEQSSEATKPAQDKE